MPTGTVKWFNVKKGYGFIKPDDGGGDVFLALKQVQQSKLPTLESGMALRFTIGANGGKAFAEGLSVIAPAASAAKTQKTRDRSPAIAADIDDEFEREWGLRRT